MGIMGEGNNRHLWVQQSSPHMLLYFFSESHSLGKVDGEIMPETDTKASHSVQVSLSPPCGCSMTSMRKGNVSGTCEHKHVATHLHAHKHSFVEKEQKKKAKDGKLITHSALIAFFFFK